MGRKSLGLAVLRLVLFVLAVMFGTPLFAEGADSAARLVGERPDPPGTVTRVSVGIYLVDIDEIDDARQRYSVDLFVRIKWKDPRLALPENNQSTQNRTLPLDEVWRPRGVIVNDRGLSPQLPLIVDVDPQGNVTYSQRLWGQLAANMEFREFPFDTQFLPIDFVSYQYSPDEMSLSSEIGMVGDEASFTIEGWRFRIVEPIVGEFTIASQGIVLPRLTFRVEAKRVSKYLMLTMVLPMSLIVFMAWTAYWLQPSIVNPRLGISTAAIFSLIALGVSFRLALPKITYLTRADFFVIGCTMLVFTSLGISVTVIRWSSGQRMKQALRLNRVARWLYPLAFAVIFTVAIFL